MTPRAAPGFAPPADPGSPEGRYRRWRAAWRQAFADWMTDGRPDFLVVEHPEGVVGGQRDGCREPGACRAGGPDLCRICAAMFSEAEAA